MTPYEIANWFHKFIYLFLIWSYFVNFYSPKIHIANLHRLLLTHTHLFYLYPKTNFFWTWVFYKHPIIFPTPTQSNVLHSVIQTLNFFLLLLQIGLHHLLNILLLSSIGKTYHLTKNFKIKRRAKCLVLYLRPLQGSFRLQEKLQFANAVCQQAFTYPELRVTQEEDSWDVRILM